MENFGISMFRYRNGFFRPDVKKKVLLIEDQLEENFPNSKFFPPVRGYSFFDEDNFVLSMDKNDYSLIEDLLKTQINPSSRLKDTDGLFKKIEIPYVDFLSYPFG